MYLIAVGRQVRSARLSRGYSQERLAELSGIHRNYIGLIERGERNMRVGTVAKLAEALDMSLAELFADLPRHKAVAGPSPDPALDVL
ncbi:helix-turn-helix transcriptional regulator [Mesorhizobium sp. B2-7-3]|uniref:helix-turn-helix domain-containing protein n=1 Tax=Mesorhizobium sp. B2-7-3 TaxID=2589907 RepID=UPI001128044E|nr:helix-turn-helix transcriptional regulator [Mesorhizobium sp. B2-7-3]